MKIIHQVDYFKVHKQIATTKASYRAQAIGAALQLKRSGNTSQRGWLQEMIHHNYR